MYLKLLDLVHIRLFTGLTQLNFIIFDNFASSISGLFCRQILARFSLILTFPDCLIAAKKIVPEIGLLLHRVLTTLFLLWPHIRNCPEKVFQGEVRRGFEVLRDRGSWRKGVFNCGHISRRQLGRFFLDVLRLDVLEEVGFELDWGWGGFCGRFGEIIGHGE